jgi:hypothetical protein
VNTVIVPIGSVRVAFGLAWKRLAGVTDAATEARLQAKTLKHRFGVIHRTDDFGYSGFVVGDAVANGAVPAAVALSGLNRDVIAFYPLSNGFVWFARSTRTGFDPDRVDQVLPEAAAVATLQQICADASRQGSTRPAIVADPNGKYDSVYLQDADKVPLDELLSAQLQGLPSIMALTGATKSRVIVYGACALGLLYVGVSYTVAWYTARYNAAKTPTNTSPSPQETLQREQARKEAIRIAIEQSLVADTTTPAPAELWRACRGAAGQLGGIFGGWKVRSIDCSAAGWSATVQLSYPVDPTFGNPATLQSAAAAINATSAVTPDLRQATVTGSYPIDGRTATTDVASLPTVQDIQLKDAGAWLTAMRVDQDLRITVGTPLPKAISFPDPMNIVDNRPVIATVPEGQTYRETVIQVAATYPWRVPIPALDRAYIALDSINLNPGSSPTTTLRFRALSRP